jgi:predicted Zn-dependent protease
VKSEQINGMTDGRQIGITSGAIHFFVWDDELAWLVAHEIAHNLLSHVQSAKLQRMLDTFLTATTGAPKRPLNAAEPGSREVQADYVGAYLIARAGYDLDAIRRAWDRFSRVEVRHTPVGTPGFPSTHPTTAERLAAFDHTLHEIEDKRRRGQSLEPRLKPTP